MDHVPPQNMNAESDLLDVALTLWYSSYLTIILRKIQSNNNKTRSKSQAFATTKNIYVVYMLPASEAERIHNQPRTTLHCCTDNCPDNKLTQTIHIKY